MQLFFIRHGAAEPVQAFASDWERPLAEEGLKQGERLAYRLTTLGVSFDRLLVSPLVRAQQTAAMILRAGLARHLETCDLLLPNQDPKELVSFVKGMEPSRAVAFVGHEPLLTRALEALLLAKPWGIIVLKKGGVAVVEGERGDWRLLALVGPEWCR